MFDIQRFMNRNNWSQYDLAREIGVSRSKVSGWCAGYRQPDYETLCKFLEKGMTLNEAFGPELEEIILKGQPSLDLSALTPEDCRKIIQMGFGALEMSSKGK